MQSRGEEIALANAMHNGDIAHQRLQDLSTQQPQAELANQAAIPVSQPPPQLGSLLSEIHAGAVSIESNMLLAAEFLPHWSNGMLP